MPKYISLAILLVLAAGCTNTPEARPQVDPDSYQVEIVHEGLDHAWGLAFLPDGGMLVSERAGRLNLIRNGEGQIIEGTPEVFARGQGGLLDVALHPAFEDNGQVYLSYAAECDGGATTHVGRGRLEDERLTDFEVLLVAEPCVGGGRHFGSRLVFDDAGYLFITTGDRGNRDSAQELDSLHGKTLRILDDGRIPDDNPFVGQASAHDAIWSYGHRNAQGMTLHPDTRELWLHEHGPRGGDEINLPQAGANFGWPLATYGQEYVGGSIGEEPPVAGLEAPLHHWTPSPAPSGMAFYTGEAFPDWQGKLFIGALAHRRLLMLTLDGEAVVNEQVLLEDQSWRIRDIRDGPDGYLYLLIDARDAPLVRLMPDD